MKKKRDKYRFCVWFHTDNFFPKGLKKGPNYCEKEYMSTINKNGLFMEDYEPFWKSWSIVCRRPEEWHSESASNTAVHSIGPIGAIGIGGEVSNQVDCFLKIDRFKGNFDFWNGIILSWQKLGLYLKLTCSLLVQKLSSNSHLQKFSFQCTMGRFIT